MHESFCPAESSSFFPELSRNNHIRSCTIILLFPFFLERWLGTSPNPRQLAYPSTTLLKRRDWPPRTCNVNQAPQRKRPVGLEPNLITTYVHGLLLSRPTPSVLSNFRDLVDRELESVALSSWEERRAFVTRLLAYDVFFFSLSLTTRIYRLIKRTPIEVGFAGMSHPRIPKIYMALI